MKFDPDIHHRRSIRLRAYDYSQPAAYFITACTHDKRSLLGEIVEGQMRMNDAGLLVHACWYGLERRYSGIHLYAFVVIPNHIHGIIRITDVGAIHPSTYAQDGDPSTSLGVPERSRRERQPNRELPLRGMGRKRRRGMLLAKIIGYFKMNTAKQINAERGTPGAPA